MCIKFCSSKNLERNMHPLELLGGFLKEVGLDMETNINLFPSSSMRCPEWSESACGSTQALLLSGPAQSRLIFELF